MTRARFLLGLALVLAGAAAHAETDPRDYEAILYLPTNTTVLIGYYRHVTSSDEQLVENQGIFRGVYIYKIGNLSLAPIDLILPVADATVIVPTGAASTTTLNASGIGDLEFLPTAIYGIQHDKLNYTYFGFTPYIFFPTGNFDGTHPVNIGANRYAFEPEIAIGQRYQMFDLELVANLTVYGDSKDHVIPAGAGTATATLQQDTSLQLAAHLSVDVSPVVYLAGSYYLTRNGRQHYVGQGFDAEAEPDQTVHTLRFGWGFRLEKASLLLLQYNQDFHTTGGAPSTRWFGARISTFF